MRDQYAGDVSDVLKLYLCDRLRAATGRKVLLGTTHRGKTDVLLSDTLNGVTNRPGVSPTGTFASNLACIPRVRAELDGIA